MSDLGYEKLEEYYGIKPTILSATDIIRIVEKWKKVVVSWDRMVYDDKKRILAGFYDGLRKATARAEKENGLLSRYAVTLKVTAFVTANVETY